MEPADRRAPNNKWQSSPAGHSFSERDIENVAMWCWTLFLARMITRVGLLLAASLWVACPWASSGMTYAFGPSKARQVYIAFEDSYLSAACIQQVAYSVGVDWRPQTDGLGRGTAGSRCAHSLLAHLPDVPRRDSGHELAAEEISG
jgi:hypothetical protein